MPDSESESARVVYGGSKAGLRQSLPTDDASFETALETVRVAAERSFSGEEIRALGIVARQAMLLDALDEAQLKPGDLVHTTGSCESNGIVLAVYDALNGTLRASVRHEGDGKGFFIHHYRPTMLAPGHVETRATKALNLAEESLVASRRRNADLRDRLEVCEAASKTKVMMVSDLRARLETAERERDGVLDERDRLRSDLADLRAIIAVQSAALQKTAAAYKSFYKWVVKQILQATYADEEPEQGADAWCELKDSMFNGTMASFEDAIDEAIRKTIEGA